MKSTEAKRAGQTWAATIGIDCADEKIDVCVRAWGGETTEWRQIPNRSEALREWVGELRGRYGEGRIAVCLEQKRGGVIYFLMSQGMFDLYPVNPKTLAFYRKAFYPSGRKDDTRDAELLERLVHGHADHLRQWKPEGEETRKLGLLTEARRKVVEDQARLCQRLGAVLKSYFPQAVEWVGEDLGTAMACDFLAKWGTLEAIQRAKPETVRKFYQTHRSNRSELIEARLRGIREARPLVEDRAVVEASELEVRMLVRELAVLRGAIREYDEAIAEVFEKHPDARIFQSLPGAGAAMAPRLLAVMGTDRERWESSEEVAVYTGIAPVQIGSGKTEGVCFRWQAPRFVRQTFHEFAQHSRHWSKWAGAYYRVQRMAGKGHQAAVRSLAFKWIRIIYRCWKERVTYDEQRYLNDLRESGSPLICLIDGEAVKECG